MSMMPRGTRLSRRLIIGAGAAVAVGAATLSYLTLAPDDGPTVGGTLRYVKGQPSYFAHLDPQRISLPDDAAFATAYLHRTLTGYTSADDPADVQLTGDLATDTGTATDDATVWSFTLRQGITFADGTPITCAEVKHGVARAFDPEVLAERGLAGAVELLDVPVGDDGFPVYQGPYAGGTGERAGVDAFDRAVSCSPDGRTITFRLNRPAGDFNHAASSLSFSPVPAGEGGDSAYDTAPVPSGPYRIEEYASEKRLTLVRNQAWERGSDPLRPAYPDRVEAVLGASPDDAVQQQVADDGKGSHTVSAKLDPELSGRATTPPGPAGRVVEGPDVGIRFLAVNTAHVPDVAHRRAIMSALDHAAVHEAAGGDRTGRLANSIIPPWLLPDGEDAPSWGELLDANLPDTGSPEHAEELIGAAADPLTGLTLAYEDTPENAAMAQAIVSSLAQAGIEVEAQQLERSDFYPAIRNPDSPYDLMLAGWTAAWMDPSTIITDLLTPAGGAANLARYDEPAFNERAEEAAAVVDRQERRDRWAALAADATADGAVIPLRFDWQRRVVGSDVHDAAISAHHGSLDYRTLWLAD